MPESIHQQLLDKVENLLYAIQNFYEQFLQMNLPEDARENFITWYGNAVDFLREQRNILSSRISSF